MNMLAWAGAACVAAAGCTVLQIPVGNTGVGKVFRLLTSAFFLCAVLLPLSDIGKGLDNLKPNMSVETAENLEETVLEQLEDTSAEILLQELNVTLANHNLVAEKLEIQMDTSADGRISITDIVLYIPSDNSLHRSWVKEIAGERLGMEVQVEYAE